MNSTPQSPLGYFTVEDPSLTRSSCDLFAAANSNYSQLRSKDLSRNIANIAQNDWSVLANQVVGAEEK